MAVRTMGFGRRGRTTSFRLRHGTPKVVAEATRPSPPPERKRLSPYLRCRPLRRRIAPTAAALSECRIPSVSPEDDGLSAKGMT